MAEEGQQRDLAGSSATFPTDSENYSSSNHELSPSPPSSSRSPMILYSPPTFWGLLRGAAINLLLPFINGLMLGFGELLAHEAAFRLGWSGTKVRAISVLSHLPGISTHCPFLCISRRTIPRYSATALLTELSLQIFPSGRTSRSVGPGIEVRDDPGERRRREQELNDMTALE